MSEDSLLRAMRCQHLLAPGDRAVLLRHFQTLIDLTELNRDCARLWADVRLMDNWLWGLSIGLTDDPAGREAIFDWIDRSHG